MHLWALTRTGAVVGGDNRPPDSEILKKAVAISDVINATEIYDKIAKDPIKKFETITIQGQEA